MATSDFNFHDEKLGPPQFLKQFRMINNWYQLNEQMILPINLISLHSANEICLSYSYHTWASRKITAFIIIYLFHYTITGT